MLKIWFAVTASGNDKDFDKLKECLVYVALREEQSLNDFKALVLKKESDENRNYKFPILLSGDLSFSFVPVQSVLEYWTDHFREKISDKMGNT